MEGLEANKNAWPAPVVRLFLRQIAPSAALAAADKERPFEVCEAQVFVGEWYLVEGSKADAERTFQSAAALCDKGTGNWRTATVELERLKAP
jgi:hypothetical protein